MARNHNHNCSSCNHSHNDCDCSCNTVVSREFIQDHPAFNVVVNGDYEADPDDEVVHVQAGLLNAAGAVIVPTVTLPKPGEVDHDAAHITIVSQGGVTRIEGLNDQATVNVDGVPSTGARFLAGGSAVTFWLSENDDTKKDCDCTSTRYWIAESADLTPAPAAAA